MAEIMQATALRTEYLENPIGIDVRQPRFFWKCEGGIRQSAYQILCTCNGKEMWDSGKVYSSKMTHIPYEGAELQSKMHADWRVRLWDEEDRPGEWSSASFEMGLLNESDWKGQWITGNYTPKKTGRYPVDYFKKDFIVKSVFPSAPTMWF